MKRIATCFLTLFALLALTTSTILAAGPFSLEKAAGAVKGGGKKCYIIGGFKLLHTLDPSIGDPTEIDASQNLNGQCLFHARIDVLNTMSNKSYSFDVNPVTGSDNIRYYRNAKKLEWNETNAYWMIEVPAGTYEVKNFTCTVTIAMNGYEPFSETWIDLPVSRGIGRTINFNVQENEIVYLGDYQCALASYICLSKQTQIYWPWKLTIDLIDNFDTVQEALLNLTKDHRTDMTIANGL